MTSSLLSRLQSLTEPNREIDAEIALANGWRQLSHDLWVDAGGQCHTEPPRFTEIFDTARTLMPSEWTLHTIHGGKKREDGTQHWYVVLAAKDGWTDEIEEEHSCSLPIALLIAIMKAKESTP